MISFKSFRIQFVDDEETQSAIESEDSELEDDSQLLQEHQKYDTNQPFIKFINLTVWQFV